MKNKLFLFLIVITLIACGEKTDKIQEDHSKAKATKDSLTNELNEILKQGHINGFGVAIVNQDTTLYKMGFGFADVKEEKPYTANSIQNIASVSKTLIGVALLKAQEMGKLNLDDPIETYLPFKVFNPNHPGEKITIRHLATHTSAILDTDVYNNKSYILKEPQEALDIEGLNERFNAPESKIPLIDFLEKVLSENGDWYQPDGFSKNKPGDIFEYSNIGATLGALVLEMAVDQPYNEFTREHILNPLKMEDSGWSFEEIELSKHSKVYATPNDELPMYSLITYPDGGLITSVSDFSKYLKEIIRGYAGKGTLLKRESYKELLGEQLPAESFLERDEEDDFDDEYNTGIFMGFTPRGYIGHTGGDPGVAIYMFFDPKTQSGRILMINTSVRNSEGVKEFYDIWNKLLEYEIRLNEMSKT